MFELPKTAQLQRHDNSAFLSNVPGEPAADTTKNRILQGHLENSNVNPVQEMAHLIKVTRMFEAVSAAIQSREGTLTEAIRVLGGDR